MSIEIQPLLEIEGGPLLGFYAKGHHETAPFTKAMIRFARREGYPCVLGGLKAKDVVRIWWRWVPFRDDGYFLGMGQYEAKPHSRGAFKVTWWEIPS